MIHLLDNSNCDLSENLKAHVNWGQGMTRLDRATIWSVQGLRSHTGTKTIIKEKNNNIKRMSSDGALQCGKAK
jgi:hypothetical protein